MMKRSTKAGVILEMVLILAGLGLLAKGGMAGLATYRFLHLANLQAAQGTVVGVRNHGFSLDFRFVADSGSQMVIPEDGFIPGHREGDSVPVLYDAKNPSLASVDSLGAFWWRTALLGPLGLLLLIVGGNLKAQRNL